MNHCRKCDSDYAKPGTCNCFAPQTAPAREDAKRIDEIAVRSRELAVEAAQAMTSPPFEPLKSATWTAQPTPGMRWTHTVSPRCECGECRAARGRGVETVGSPIGWTLTTTTPGGNC